jgi:amino acid adenylation domain-containing protein
VTQSFPPSVDQTRLWFLWRLEPDSSDYNLSRALRIRDRLDVAALRFALDAIAARHEVLRTSLPERDGHPVQLVAAPVPVPLPVTDVGGVGAARDAIAAEARRPFELTKGPLFRARLLRLGEQEHILAFVFHQVVMDAVSLAIFFDELSALYGAALRGQASPLAPLTAQYSDHAAGQGDDTGRARLEADLAYWRRRLAGAPGLVELPVDRSRSAVRRLGHAVAVSALPAETWAAVGALCARERAAPFVGFVAGYAALLSRLGAGPDVVIGTPVSGRARAEHHALIGCFANTLPIRIDLGGDPPFREILRRTRGAVHEALAHQHVPFQKLVEALAPERSVSHAPIVQTTFTAEDAAAPVPRLPGADVELLELSDAPARLDLVVRVAPAPKRADGPSHDLTITYNVNLFEPASIDRLAERYGVLLTAVAAAPDTRLSAIPLLGPAERSRVLEWGWVTADSRPVELVHAAVARRAREEPARAAVEHGQRRLSYGELDARAGRLAGRLLALGAGPERVVGVLLPRSIELVVAELGVLRAGAAYLPLDPVLPARRVEVVLREAGAAMLVTTAELAGKVAGAVPAIVHVDGAGDAPPGPPAVEPDPRSLAYVIGTSGSTGAPKVVMIEHRPLAQMARWYGDLLGVRAGDRLSMLFSPGFDGSVSEIWGALAAGATSCVADEEARFSAARFQRWTEEAAITVAGMPVPVSEEVLALSWRPEASLRVFYTGADRLRKRPRPDAPFRVLNVYGPTEDTFGSTVAAVTARDAGLPPIGRPVPGTAAYVLDPSMEPVGASVAGELHLGGAGLARGYLGQPAMTAARFVPNPFAATPGERLYRTGDVVRWRTDGSLEFVGRTDDQLKIRGFRIEPAEVEAALHAHPSVAAVHVCGHRLDDPREARLVAYVVPAEGGPAPAARELREHLSASLPAYMVPDAYVELDRLPLTARGKIDRAALPEPGARVEQAAYEAPATELERSLAIIWQQVLRLDRVGVRESFFDLGGHSLMLIAVQQRIAQDVGRDVPVHALFQQPTIADLARYLRGERRDQDRPLEQLAADREAGLARARRRRQQIAGRPPHEEP